MKYFITGGAGFIGSSLSNRLLQNGHAVTVFDDFSTGQLRFLDQARTSEKFRLVEGGLLDEQTLNQAMAGHDFVFHLAANADVRFGTDHPRRDLEHRCMRKPRSSGSVRSVCQNVKLPLLASKYLLYLAISMSWLQETALNLTKNLF